MSTSMGASSAVTTRVDDEPMCRQTSASSSQHADQNGSQWSEWKLGRRSFAGFSEKLMAWQPLAATRCTSAAIRCGSHSGGSASGMKRPGYVPHHSSMCQSLYARRMARAASLSFERANTCPQRLGTDGKHVE